VLAEIFTSLVFVAAFAAAKNRTVTMISRQLLTWDDLVEQNPDY
jgi:hypothetical protein